MSNDNSSRDTADSQPLQDRVAHTEGAPIENAPATDAPQDAPAATLTGDLPAATLTEDAPAEEAPTASARRYRTLLLDLDGTLLDTLQDLADAGNYMAAQMGWPVHEVAAYRMMVGNGQRVLATRIAPPELRDDAELMERAYRIFTDRYEAHRMDHTAPYPGILPVLERIRQAGIRIGVLTNKNEESSRQMVRDLLGDVIEYVVGRKDGVPAKPDPTMGRNLMKELGATPDSTLMVGDSKVDMECGRNLGVETCGVLWGFRSREELVGAGAVYLVSTPDELVQLLGL